MGMIRVMDRLKRCISHMVLELEDATYGGTSVEFLARRFLLDIVRTDYNTDVKIPDLWESGVHRWIKGVGF